VYRWMDDPQFCAWFTDQCERLFRHHVPAMWQKCLELAIAGSPEHIKLIAMRTGELRTETQGVGAAQAGITQVFVNVPRPPRERDDDIEIGSPVLRLPMSDEQH
jgi:hypothetical protein